MRIYIPSLSRAKTVGVDGTLPWIPEEWLGETHVVVREDQHEDYFRTIGHYGCRILSTSARGIATTRHAIGLKATAHGVTKFLQLDDDLNFATRKSEDDYHLRPSAEDDMRQMLRTVDRLLDDYAHVSISMRQGNNHVAPGPSPLVVENTRGIRAMAFRTREFMEAEHGRLEVMEDFDVTLQLLRRGHKNAVVHWWAQDQKQTNAPGGCSTYRSQAVQTASAELLRDLHPDFVRLRLKENKSGGEFGKRTEVTVFWKKAWESSR